MNWKTRHIKAVMFDFDGTLTKPGTLDFTAMKKAIDCPASMPVLEFIESISDHDRKAEALLKLKAFELDAAVHSEPNIGAEEMILYLRSMNLRTGILSRNCLQSIRVALNSFKKIGISDFDLLISRDDPVKPKPSPDGILWAAKKLKINTNEILVVGDYIFDVQAGQSAGAVTVFLDNSTTGSVIVESDYRISMLGDLKRIIRRRIPLPAGKLPNDLLEEVLHDFAFDDPAVLIRPGVGEDIAAVDVKNDEVLTLKSDPITFASDAIGQYAVLINANDIATSGAIPRWFLATLLFPCGITGFEIGRIMQDLNKACREWDISLCGGHTEITDSVTRPVITGMMVGTVAKNRLIDKHNIKSGDRVLLTKAVAVEGTSIIAREFGEKLRHLGQTESEINECGRFLEDISILKEAKIAGTFDGVSAMHDVTEGGLATALEELSIAGRHKIIVDINRIPIYPQTEKICSLLGINPLGLIGSGSLLICCSKDDSEDLMHQIRKAGIAVTPIGDVMGKGRGIEAVRDTRRTEWPRFEVDEITRLF